MIPIIGTGLSGLVGSRVTKLLSHAYSFTDLSKETNVDLMDFSTVDKCISASLSAWVFHFAAYTNVQGAEDEKDQKERSISWQVNVSATENIVNICKKTGKHLLYISTDYVFDGINQWYEEDNIPNPLSWYGKTKYEGEKIVQELGEKGLIIRITNPYRSFPETKKDFLHKIMERLQKGQDVVAPSDQEFSPTFIDDLGGAIDCLVQKKAHGVYHVVSKHALSPYRAAQEISRTFGFPEHLVGETTYEAYFQGKALPPKHANLKHDKIDALGVKLHTFDEGIRLVKSQEQKGS